MLEPRESPPQHLPHFLRMRVIVRLERVEEALYGGTAVTPEDGALTHAAASLREANPEALQPIEEVAGDAALLTSRHTPVSGLHSIQCAVRSRACLMRLGREQAASRTRYALVLRAAN